jgi:LCP family protein required for cell wall assembly
MTERKAAAVDQVSPANPSTRAKPSPRRRLMTVAGRTIAALLTVAVLVATGVGWIIHQRADTAMAARQVDALVPDDPHIRPAPAVAPSPIGARGAQTSGTQSSGPQSSGPQNSDSGVVASVQPAPEPAEPVTAEQAAAMPAENILILGLDTRGNGENGVGPGTSQSDVIMLAHLHAGHRSMSVLSIPRDLYVPAPSCKQWDNATGKVSDQDFTSPYTSWKITNAYSVGGPRCTVKAVQGLTGLRIDRLITIQFEGFKSIVDALGGVRMSFRAPVIDGYQGVVIASQGSQIVSGEQALRLVRSRTVKGDPSGDLGRIGRQQKLISAIMHQVSSSGLFSDPAKLDRVVQTFVAHSTVANVTIDRLLEVARALGGGTGSVAFSSLPTVAASGSDGLEQAPQDQKIFAELAADQQLSH